MLYFQGTKCINGALEEREVGAVTGAVGTGTETASFTSAFSES